MLFNFRMKKNDKSGLIPRALGPIKKLKIVENNGTEAFFLQPNELQRNFEAPKTELDVSGQESVCFLMHNFYLDLREWMH